MSASHNILLQRTDSGEFVDAVLLERINPAQAKAAHDAWRTYLRCAEDAANAQGISFVAPPHAHWEWTNKVAKSAHLLSYPTLAVECDSEVQGMMLVITDGYFGKLPNEAGKPLVYIELLGTAPWNLPGVTQRPQFRGVGTIFLRAAVEMSIDIGFKGRIGLHSLPQSEGFYECNGLHCLGQDVDKEMKYYELSPEGAAEFLK